MSFEFFEYTDVEKVKWDDFVINHFYGSVHQVSDWKNFQEKIPGRGEVLGFGIRDKVSQKICATTFVVRMETGIAGKFWYYSARGPVFDPVGDLEAGRDLICQVSKRLKDNGAIFWRIDPYFSEANYSPFTKGRHEPEECIDLKVDKTEPDIKHTRRGACPPKIVERRGISGTNINLLPFRINTATQNYQPTNTLEINLQQTNEEILAGMKRKGRYNINLAKKKGVQIQTIKGSEITEEALNDFWELNNETTARDAFASHGKDYYANFCKYISDYVTLFLAKTEDGTPIATAINTHCGKKAIYYFGASTSNPEYRNLMAPYLLQWEMMQYARKKGCTSYDFLGIAPKNEPKHPYAGISEFKWKFGGNRRVYAGGKEIVFRPGWYGLYRGVKKIKN